MERRLLETSVDFPRETWRITLKHILKDSPILASFVEKHSGPKMLLMFIEHAIIDKFLYISGTENVSENTNLSIINNFSGPANPVEYTFTNLTNNIFSGQETLWDVINQCSTKTNKCYLIVNIKPMK